MENSISPRRTIILSDTLAKRPDMHNAIHPTMLPDDMLEKFSELASRESELLRRVLQAAVAEMVNTQSVEAC